MKLINRLSFKREITFITLFSINFSGVFPLKQQTHITVRYVWIIVATFGTLYMSGLSIIEPFLRSYGFLVNITIVLNVLTSLVGYCTPVISLFSNAELVKLLELLDGGFYTYTDERKFQVRKFSTEDLLSKEISICTLLSVTYIGMTLTPLAVNLLLKDHENSAFDLLYVAWVPFGIKTGKQFFFSYIMQFLSTIPNYTSFIGTILFIYNVSREFRYQSDKLRFALKSICDRVNNKIILEEYETNPSDEIIRQRFVKCNEDEFLEKLKECMFHHQQLQKFLGYFSSWFNLIFSCQLTYGFLSFALIGYVMITGTGNIATDGKYVCLLGLFSGQLYYQCVVGEIIFTIINNFPFANYSKKINIGTLTVEKLYLLVENPKKINVGQNQQEAVIEEFYNIPWHEQTPKVKKTVQMFLNAMQQKKKLRGFKLWPASIPIFTTIVRTSYSYLNLLNKMMHKSN